MYFTNVYDGPLYIILIFLMQVRYICIAIEAMVLISFHYLILLYEYEGST